MELLIILLVIVALVGFVAVLYNRLVGLRNAYINAFAQIDVQLKRRHDLIPQLVETVKGYMKHERETLEAVIQARNQAEQIREAIGNAVGDPQAMSQLGQAEGALGGLLGRLFALSEAYPDLKASENFRQFQEELTSTENRVAYARQAYNDAGMAYNNAVQSVPSNFIANTFGFREIGMLEFEDREVIQQAPRVSFD
ncbi:LemA family protein [Chelativorans salis]|uniref:LemA family protein n=1 Tax=Chelativorans salis TaxID=2978478 RepID=A0ABT2LI19_9HYPH|nr:LemA family protein [Chelativorans sp. EGI FJ00035]MCT7374226.1 LemA family protein [Chelativorans sp. EGI FJ00035]